MARDKEEGGEYQFVPPDFDEDAFIHREMVHFKVTVAYFVWALLAALASYLAFVLLGGNTKAAWPAGIAIAVALGFAFRPLMARFADVAIFKRNDWVWKYVQYALAWLALFTLAVNPPVTDISPPEVLLSADPALQAQGQTVTLTLIASDNDHLAGNPAVRLERDGEPVAVQVPPTSRDGAYSIPLAGLQPGRYTVTAEATDGRGLMASARAGFNVTAGELLTLRLPPGGNLSGEEQVTVKVQAKACAAEERPGCVRVVFFNPTGCDKAECTVPFGYEADLDRWVARATYAGWKEGTNNGTIRAEFLKHYLGRTTDGKPREIDAGTLSSGPVELQVDVPPGDPFKPVVHRTAAPAATAAGWGALAVLASVLGAAALARRRGSRER